MVSRIERLEKQYKDNMEKANNAKTALDKLRREQNRQEKIALRKARNHALLKSVD